MGADPARGMSLICCDSDNRRGRVEDEALDGAGAEWGVLTGLTPPIPGDPPGGPAGDGELPPSCNLKGVLGVEVEAGYGLAPPYWLYPPPPPPPGGAPAF